MKRKNILLRLGSCLVILVMLAGLLNSCSKKDEAAQVNFTIDVTDPQYSQLSGGQAVVVNNIIIVRLYTGNYIALSAYCTYDENTLTWNPSYNQFVDQLGCGSKFNTDGSVAFGPATGTGPLVRYNTLLTGNILQIYS